MPTRITKLSARNMQGQTFADDLAVVTLICGDNARGKTTRINALHLVLAGYAPGIPQKGHEIFAAFATGNPLQVKGIISKDGSPDALLLRTWTEQRGSVKYDGPPPDYWCPMPPVMVDADAYFGLSGPERTRFIFARATLPAELTVANIAQLLIANAKNIKVEENTPESEEAIGEVVDVIAEHQGKYKIDATVQDWVAELAEDLRERKNLADQNVKRLDKTVQGLAQVREQAAAAPQDAEVRLTEARTALEAANGDVARLLEAGKALGRELDELTAKASSAVDQVENRKRIAELEANPPANVAPPGERTAYVMTKARPTDIKENEALATAEANFNASRRAQTDAEAVVTTLESEVEMAKKQTTCPTCGHDISDKQKKVIADLNKKLKVAQKNLKPITDALNKTVEAHANAVNARSAATKAITDWDSQKTFSDSKNKAESDAWQARSDAYNAFLTATNKRNADLNVLRGTLTDTVAAEAAAKLPKLQADVATAREQYNAAVLVSAEKKTACLHAEGSYKLLLQERAAAADRAKVIGESVKAKAELSVLKLAVEMVLELQTKLVEAAVGPIVAACNRLCAGVLQHPLAYKDGEIGIASPKGFVTHRTMSGAERTLTRCAVSLALAAGAPFKLAIIDEMGRLSARNKKLVVANVIKLVQAGEIHQAILVDTADTDYTVFENEYADIFGVIRV